MKSSYSDQAKAHLAEYKRSVLGVAEDGVWAKNGQAYPHILPESLGHLNILAPYRDVFWQHPAGMRERLHRDFHHLTSSQAMAFNLFFPPLFEEGKLASRLVAALTGQASGVRTWEFEAVPDAAEKTNYDLLLELESGSRVYVEAKFTEAFGTAPADTHHRDKLEQIYRERLTGKVAARYLEESTFFANYQLLRTVAQSRTGLDVVRFVLPSRHRFAAEHASEFITNALLPNMTGVAVVTVESVVECLVADHSSTTRNFSDHYKLFSEKYLWGDETA